MAAKPVSKLSMKDRVSFRALILFAVTFLIVFTVGLVIDVFATMMEGRLAESAVPAEAPIVLDPKIETDLAQVLSFDAFPNSRAVKDPFVDRAGISDKERSAFQTSPPPVQQASVSAPNQGSSSNFNSGGGASRVASTSEPVEIRVNPASPEATFARIRARDDRIRAGLDGGPESAVFAIEDLLPVGLVSGGNGDEEVMLYSLSMKRTISFPIGTRFFDGWLMGFRPEGVVFSFNDPHRTTWIRHWERDTKSRRAEYVPRWDSPDWTAIEGGNF